MTYRVVKFYGRLWIEILETGEKIYTPPDFMRHRIHSRENMQRLADTFTEKQQRSIEDIMEFES